MSSKREVKQVLGNIPKRPPLARALLPFAADAALWAAGLAVVALPTASGIKIVGSLVIWVASARLFILGHDACHGSTTSYARWNRMLARLAFLPTLTPCSLWALGHNVAHHGYNNLKGRDYVWTPLSPAEYFALSRGRRRLERIYRSGWGPGLYYLIELWWKKLFFPSSKHVGARRSEFSYDCRLVTGFAALWVGLLVVAASVTHQFTILLLVLGCGLPFLLWNCLIGFVVFIHHTHPDVDWYDDKAEWGANLTHLKGTVHVRMPLGINRILHNIFDHTAHHVDTSISWCYLQPAQQLLEAIYPENIMAQEFSWRWYFNTAKKCQLYDYDKRRWATHASVEAPHS